MDRRGCTRPRRGLLAGLGVGLYGVAAVWHLGVEASDLVEWNGLVLAFALDGIVPLALVYGSYRWSERSSRWSVSGRWSGVLPMRCCFRPSSV